MHAMLGKATIVSQQYNGCSAIDRLIHYTSILNINELSIAGMKLLNSVRVLVLKGKYSILKKKPLPTLETMKNILLLSILIACATIRADQTILPYAVNAYNDIEVTIEEKDVDIEIFQSRLSQSIAYWKAQGQKAIWLTLPDSCIRYLPSLADQKFQFHHYKDKKIIMTLWLLEDIESILPNYPAHQAAVCGLVIDDQNNILAVRNSYDTVIKMPGGGIELGEQLGQAAMREVKEETDIDTEFVALVAFRHGGKFSVGMGDSCAPQDYSSKFYFCCLLKPLNHTIAKQESEIDDACWMPYSEFKAKTRGIFLDFLRAYETGKYIHPVEQHLANTMTFYYAD